jgi:hypothetical protein
LHWGVVWTRAALALIAAGAVGLAAVSGGSVADPRTPAGLAGMPPPFLGTAVVGDGGLTAAIDAYGDVVDLRVPGPAGRAPIEIPAARQAAGSVAIEAGIVPRVSLSGGPSRPLWRADSVTQRYRPGTNVLVTAARFGASRVAVVYAAHGERLACLTHTTGRARVSFGSSEVAGAHLRCNCQGARNVLRTAASSDRHWLSRARGLGPGAPGWARRMYRRSLLSLRALTDRDTGAVAAGARDGWAYVWPRDAGTAALAFAAAGERPDARRVARFLLGLDLSAAARFRGNGAPVGGRAAQGDAAGWVAVAARAAGFPAPARSLPWQGRADYQEGGPGEYLGNAIAGLPNPKGAGDLQARFGAAAGLARRAGDPTSGLDSAAAWAVRPFPSPALYPAARRTLLHLADERTRFGIVPGSAWPGTDPWTAPTAWSAWSLAALGERRAALSLVAALRRAATDTGALPERLDARTGVPVSTTPLAWSHAFAILALRQLWPPG